MERWVWSQMDVSLRVQVVIQVDMLDSEKQVLINELQVYNPRFVWEKHKPVYRSVTTGPWFPCDKIAIHTDILIGWDGITTKVKRLSEETSWKKALKIKSLNLIKPKLRAKGPKQIGNMPRTGHYERVLDGNNNKKARLVRLVCVEVINRAPMCSVCKSENE